MQHDKEHRMNTTSLPITLLRLPQVLACTGYSRSGWYKAIAEGRAPKPIKRGRISLWSSDSVQSLIQAEILDSQSRSRA